MNITQRIILVLGAALTIYFVAFAPFTKQVTVDNPDYDPESKGRYSTSQNRYTTEQQADYLKKLAFAGSSAIGTAVLFFIAKN